MARSCAPRPCSSTTRVKSRHVKHWLRRARLRGQASAPPRIQTTRPLRISHSKRMTNTPSAALLQARALSRDFGPIRALDDFNLSLKAGEILGLLGPNGAGKTTTLRLLTGALAPTRGQITICGHDLRTRPLAAKHCL